MKSTTPGKELSGSDIVLSNLTKNINNLKSLINEEEALRREVIFILDRYPSHREWKTLASFQAKSRLDDIRSQVRSIYKKDKKAIPSDKDLSAEMIFVANRLSYDRIGKLHISLEVSEEYLQELKNL